MKEISDRLLFEFYQDILIKRGTVIMSMRFNDDLSLTEIAENVGISKQGVKDYIDRSMAKIRKLEASTGAYHKYRKAADFLTELSEKADKDLARKINKFLEDF